MRCAWHRHLIAKSLSRNKHADPSALMNCDTYYMLNHRINDAPLVSLGTWKCHFGHPGSVTDLDDSQ
jgi:hypothetical protein